MRWIKLFQTLLLVLALTACVNGDASDPKCSQNQPQPSDEKLKKLRDKLKEHQDNIYAYVVPSGDAHQSEYIAPYSMRRSFISGFTGSAGTAIVTRDKAALWTDGRYFLQGATELDCNWILMKSGLKETPSMTEWLLKELPAGGNAGVDPFLMSINSWQSFESRLATKGHKMIPISENFIDTVWIDKPSRPDAPLIALDLQFTGKKWQDKIDDLRKQMTAAGAMAIVEPQLDNVAWLFNLRGSDIPYNPVFFSYAIVTMDKIELYIDDNKVAPAGIKTHLDLGTCQSHCITIRKYNDLLNGIKTLSDSNPSGKIWLSPRTSSYAIYSQVKKEQRYLVVSPISLSKAMKNDVERQRMRETYIKESAVYCNFMAWLSKQIAAGNTDLTEISVDDQLTKMRREAFPEEFKGLSFASISAVGANGAIIHYKASKESDTKLDSKQIYLLDTGGQYLGGTTDTTRTWKFTPGTSYERDCFTRVLMGSIDLAQAVWKENTHGRVLDVIARLPLYRAGLEYRHGTGHGIGIFLNVHEGPGRITSGIPNYYEKPLAPGMFLSDEPGYYEAGKFGIRLETIVMVKKANTKVPFDMINLANITMLTKEQRVWVNNYNRLIRQKVGSFMQERKWEDGYNWMMEYTKPIPLTDDKPNNNNSAIPITGGTAAILIITTSILMLLNYLNRN